MFYLYRICALFSVIFLLHPANSIAQSQGEDHQKLITILGKKHVSPKTMDDAWSASVFRNTLEQFNDFSLIFSQSDIASLDAFKTVLDNDFPRSSCKFADEVTAIYKKRAEETVAILSTLNAQNITFAHRESYRYLESDSLVNSFTEQARKDAVVKYIKLSTLRTFFDEANETLTNRDSLKIAFERQKSKLVEETIDGMKSHLTSQLNNPEGYRKISETKYFNAICETFDPHTQLFSSAGKDEFDILLSDKYYSFGIEIEAINNRIAVKYIVPGGPAWLCNEIHKGDIITNIALEGDKDVRTDGQTVWEIEKLLRSNTPISAEFTLQTTTGLTQKQVLTATQIENDDNIVKSYLLQGNKRIGYISLPGFYTDSESPTMLGCANDVAKEIVKLKKSDISGLILDLRYNGGGSLKEAIDLAGIFIDFGTMLIMKESDGTLTSVKDMNRGAIYTGPLTVLVNRSSASASEIVSAILQDHNRALVVGTETFGKASGQNMMLVDSASGDKSDFIKITDLLLYRLDGTSYQKHGVAPDISIPDPFCSFYETEADYLTSLDAGSVSKKTYFTPFPKIATDSLRALSSGRLAANKAFMDVRTMQAALETEDKQFSRMVPLDFDTYYDKHLNIYTLSKKIEAALATENKTFEAQYNQFETGVNKIDSDVKNMHENQRTSLTKDIILEEAFLITSDYISQQSK